jgi:hypothetical protein
MSEPDDEVHFGVVSDIDSKSNDTGNYVRASASTGKLRRNLLKPKSKQKQNLQPAMLGTRTNAYNVLGKKRPGTESVNRGRGATRACKGNVVFYHRHWSLLKCKLNVGLLEDSVFLDKLCVKLLEDDLAFRSIFDDPLQFEEEEQIEEHARLRLAQKGEAEEDEQAGEHDDALVVAEDEEFDVFADWRNCGSAYGIVLHARVWGASNNTFTRLALLW